MLVEHSSRAGELTPPAAFHWEYPTLMNDPADFEVAAGVVTGLFDADCCEAIGRAVSTEDLPGSRSRFPA